MERGEFRETDDVLSEQIIGIFYQVHKELGYGFLEAIYRRSMALALTQAGLFVEEEIAVPVVFRGVMLVFPVLTCSSRSASCGN